ncbi:glycosyltransferase family 4 protein [Oxalobacteraceae bacterium R-40]|uniref:Glycosyltransferase family 4 protein n=1 Tax=Keguizhuia sedimenti TaxID=3064264 RepID=A0ABU1BL51_9BURK|nr:glycosyltransferase family 4 protein [Oxalobacteraceae bacterium R-40]
MIKVALIANEPPPYRIPIFNRLAALSNFSLQVLFCCRREPNRHWNYPAFEFDHVFLREHISEVNGRYIHNNPDVFGRLREFSPDVVVTNGFNPTHLYAFSYAAVRKTGYVVMTDGTAKSERRLSIVHRMIRRLVYARADAYVYASLGGKELYADYNIAADRCFQSHLCVNNDTFKATIGQVPKRFDFIVSGRIDPIKNPFFALAVAKEVAGRLNRKVRILFVGAGGLSDDLKRAAHLEADLVEAHFHGFAKQEELPSLYQSAWILLFPSLWDPWGVVANEACASGVPVIVSPHAGAAGELIIDKLNGFICELDVNLWAEHAVSLLTKPPLWQDFSQRSLSAAEAYNFDTAASGLADACSYAAKRRSL